jgi:hypothetical protein
MITLSQIKKRAEKTIRKSISAEDFLLWTNEAIEQLSEVAKIETEPIKAPLDNDYYLYVLFKNGLHKLYKDYRLTTVDTYDVYVEDGETISKDWEDEHVISQYIYDEDKTILTIAKFSETNNMVINGAFEEVVRDEYVWFSRDTDVTFSAVNNIGKVEVTGDPVEYVEIYNPSQATVESGDNVFFNFRFKVPQDSTSYSGMKIEVVIDYGADETGASPTNTDLIDVTPTTVESDKWYEIYEKFEMNYSGVVNFGIRYTIEPGATSGVPKLYIDGLYGVMLLAIDNTDFDLSTAIEILEALEEETVRTVIKTTENIEEPYSNGEIVNYDEVALRTDPITLETYLNTVDQIKPLEDSDEIEDKIYIQNNAIKLPENFQEIIKVEIIYGSEIYTVQERSQSNDEVVSSNYLPNQNNTTYHQKQHIYYLSNNDTILNVKSYLLENNCEIKIYYYKDLPTYTLDADETELDSLEIPLDKKFYNLINYYVIHKYNEGWKDYDTSNLYLNKFIDMKNQYAQFISDKYLRNQRTQHTVTKSWGL